MNTHKLQLFVLKVLGILPVQCWWGLPMKFDRKFEGSKNYLNSKGNLPAESDTELLGMYPAQSAPTGMPQSAARFHRTA
jgi:hypothetical protein